MASADARRRRSYDGRIVVTAVGTNWQASLVKLLYERLRASPWPALAKNVGDFAFYESLLAGCADRVVRGGLLDVSKIPIPDAETIAYTSALRAKSNRTSEEAIFLGYFDLLEQIRLALIGQ
jgi:hypothetical protein